MAGNTSISAASCAREPTPPPGPAAWSAASAAGSRAAVRSAARHAAAASGSAASPASAVAPNASRQRLGAALREQRDHALAHVGVAVAEEARDARERAPPGRRAQQVDEEGALARREIGPVQEVEREAREQGVAGLALVRGVEEARGPDLPAPVELPAEVADRLRDLGGDGRLRGALPASIELGLEQLGRPAGSPGRGELRRDPEQEVGDHRQRARIPRTRERLKRVRGRVPLHCMLEHGELRRVGPAEIGGDLGWQLAGVQAGEERAPIPGVLRQVPEHRHGTIPFGAEVRGDGSVRAVEAERGPQRVRRAPSADGGERLQGCGGRARERGERLVGGAPPARGSRPDRARGAPDRGALRRARSGGPPAA
ncbi:hypothetical protein ACMHYB_28570 [Sorangium sp. So ce1128]